MVQVIPMRTLALSPLSFGPLLLVMFALSLRGDFQGSTHLLPYDEDLLGYAKSADTGPVARLQERIDRGEVTLTRDDRFGYLPAILRELGISTSSQMLVFSKTSFQRDRISPHNPRALYFNDSAYVGYIPGADLLEFTSVDPRIGAVFYTLDQATTDRPRFVRTDNCTECHASAKTMGIPGHLVRSFQTDESGRVDLLTGVDPINHRTPLEKRWGGWFVTGTHGDQPHRGNLVGKAAFVRQESEPNHVGNLTSLERFFDPARFPAPGSDIVALMVMEHQTHGQNFLTRVAYEARLQLGAYGHVNYLKTATEALVKYLLLAEELPLTAPIQGDPAFVRDFIERGPRDPKGRSLRDLDLQTRLFKYPCSYLIQTEPFLQLPDPLRERVYKRMYEVLSGADTSPTWSRLSTPDRVAILEILRATQKDLPKDWFP